jgi:hypothetical protein
VFVAGVLTTTGRIVFHAVGSAQPRNDLLGPGGVVAIRRPRRPINPVPTL